MKNENVTHIVKAILPLLLLLTLLYSALFRASFYPVITNSVSLDAKILDCRRHEFVTIDVMSIGSSMNLNNLNSSELKLPDVLTTYYNLGAWGLQITDTLHLAKYFTSRYKPKCVLVSSSIPDFVDNGKIVLPDYYELDLVRDYLPYFYLKSSIVSVINRRREYHKNISSNDDYTNLDFDESGGATLNIPKEKISKTRWDEKLVFPNKNTAHQYVALRDLSLFLKNEKIIFHFIQTPMRKAMFDAPGLNRILQTHFNTCKSVVECNGGHYVNIQNQALFDDTLFVDQFHLSSAGSKIFTKQVSEKMNDMLGSRF